MTDYNSLFGKLWWFYQLAFDAVVSLQCRDLLNKKFKRNSVSLSSQSCAISCSLCCCMPQQTTFRQVMRKPAFLCVKTKILFSCTVNMQLISDQGLCFCYISSIIPLLLKPELNEPSTCCSQLLRLYSPVCVRPDLKPPKHLFSLHSSFHLAESYLEYSKLAYLATKQVS